MLVPVASVAEGITPTQWTNFVPTLTATGGNPTLGSGSTQVGRYYTIGKLCIAQIHIRFGSSGAAAGTGEYIVSTPVPFSASASADVRAGFGQIADETGTIRRNVSPFQWSTPSAGVKMMSDAAFAFVSATSPWTWAALDDLNVTLLYEID